MTTRRSSRTFKHIKFVNSYRSGLEADVAEQLDTAGIAYEYETRRLPYKVDAKYVPDFIIGDMIIECKGRFTSEDRRKMRLVKEQHPELDIRFVFSRSSSKINKGSKTTYAAWCDKYGFKYADKLIPDEWLVESKHDTKPKIN